MNNKKGLFIALEGPDGSGKSTIANNLASYLESLNVDYALTREPGGTDISEQIRKILLSNENSKMTNKTEALLYAASRAQHVEEKIKPLLEKGTTVISDRYIFSSLAYQGHSRGLGIEQVMEINRFAMGKTYPDVTLFFDISSETALARKFNNREGDRLENEGVSFHNKTYEGYIQAINKYPSNVYIIDANGEIEDTLKQCIEILNKFIKREESL